MSEYTENKVATRKLVGKTDGNEYENIWVGVAIWPQNSNLQVVEVRAKLGRGYISDGQMVETDEILSRKRDSVFVDKDKDTIDLELTDCIQRCASVVAADISEWDTVIDERQRAAAIREIEYDAIDDIKEAIRREATR